MCVLLAVITVIAMTSVAVFADNTVSEPAQENSAADNSVNDDTIIEVIVRGEGTLVERLIHGGQVTLVGMIVVFAVLVILMIILYLFPLIFSRQSAKKTSEKPVEKTVSAPAHAPVATLVSASEVMGEEVELVAVATAAIAAYRGASDCAFNVISITRIN